MLKNFKTSFNILYIVFFIITIIYMLIKPEISINTISDTILLFTNTVMPSLFPFILCTQVLIMLGGAKIIGFPIIIIIRILGYDDNAAGAYAASLLGGYPTGASSLNLLYNQNMLKGNYLAYMLLCSNCGPMFILATVGMVVLGSYKIGIIIFASHILGALITSIIAMTIKPSDTAPSITTNCCSISEYKSKADIFDIIEKAIINTARIMVKIFGMLCFFRLISDMIFKSNVLLFFQNKIGLEVLIRGALELVDGCLCASILSGMKAAVYVSFIVSFGGLSAIFQSISVSKDIPYSKKLFVLGKVIHGFISALICYILIRIIPVSITASMNSSMYYYFYSDMHVTGFTFVIIGICAVFMVIKSIFGAGKQRK